MFIPIWGNDPILTNIFQKGWNHQLGNIQFRLYYQVCIIVVLRSDFTQVAFLFSGIKRSFDLEQCGRDEELLQIQLFIPANL